ncbi:MAG: hypothetical protein RSP_04640 [Rhodanobacter sp.]
MVASTRHETLIKAITDLGEEGGGNARKSNANRAIASAWQATIEAIDALKDDRAKRLTAAVVAVMIDRSEKQATRVLQGPPRIGSFQHEHKNPKDFALIAMLTPAYDGKKVKRDRWVYNRNRVKGWWKKRQHKQNEAAEDRQQKIKIARLLKQRADLADRLQQTNTSMNAVDRQLAQLGVKLFIANATLEAATIEPQPWLITVDGWVQDQAWLPVSSTEAITQLLEEGGDIQWMPLAEALRDHPWSEEKTREAWADVWRVVAARERTRIDSGLAVIRVRGLSMGDGLPSKERLRS